MKKIFNIITAIVIGFGFAILLTPMNFIKNWLQFVNTFLQKRKLGNAARVLDKIIVSMPDEDKRLFNRHSFEHDEYFVKALRDAMLKVKDQGTADFESLKIAEGLDKSFPNETLLNKIVLRNTLLSGTASVGWSYEHQIPVLVNGAATPHISFFDKEDPISRAFAAAREKASEEEESSLLRDLTVGAPTA